MYWSGKLGRFYWTFMPQQYHYEIGYGLWNLTLNGPVDIGDLEFD